MGARDSSTGDYLFGAVCDRDRLFGQAEADVLCREIGYADGAVQPVKGDPDSINAAVKAPVALFESFRCPDDANATLANCTFSVANSTCGSWDLAQVECAGELN